MPTIFSRIITGEIPSYKIYEDELTFAFLDIHPYTLWHTLIVPKTEVDHFYDLPEPYYSAIFQTAKKLAPTLQKATKSKRISMFLIGLDVPHVHIHLVPTNTVDDIQKNATHQESEEAMKQIQQAIISYL